MEYTNRGGTRSPVRHGELVPTAPRAFAVVLTVCYAIILGVALFRHEMWRDELQAWMLARDSASPMALIHNMRYEGHPPLWHLVLWVVSRVTRAPQAMQVVQWSMAVATTYLVARFAPAPRVVKVLVVASYYLAFEYGVISRSYGLGLLLLVIACALWRTRRRGYGKLALTLALLALTSVYGLLLSVAFAAALAVDAAADARLRRAVLRRRRRLAAAALLAGTLSASVAIMRPPADAPFTGNHAADQAAFDSWELASTGALVWRAYVPIPRPAAREPWNTNILRTTTRGQLMLALALSALLVVVVAIPLVARRPAALTLYVAATGALLTFSYLRYSGTQRHHGHLFLALLAAVWLARSRMAPWPRQVSRLVPRRLASPQLARVAAGGLCALLAVQSLVAARMLFLDLREPFSGAGEAAAYVRDSMPAGTIVAGRPSPSASAVSAMLDRPIHYLDDDVTGTFVVWGPGRADGSAKGHELQRVAPLLPADGAPLTLVLSYPLEDVVPPPGITVRALTHARASFVASEDLYLYEVRKVAGRGPLKVDAAP